MTSEEFKHQIEVWKGIAAEEGVRLPSGAALPEKYWALFLGLAVSSFNKLKGDQSDVRTIQPYTAKHIQRINLLPRETFVAELHACVEEYLAKMRAKKFIQDEAHHVLSSKAMVQHQIDNAKRNR